MTQHADAATEACWVCGGPCRAPFRLPPIPLSYPFMSQEAIMATHPAPDPQPDQVRRGRRRGENRAHLHPAETTARQPAEDRS